MQAELDQFPEVRELSQERYLEFEQRYNQRFGRVEFGPESAVNNLLNMIAARVSHCFDWKGPSLVVDTACSSSLVATHLACESLRRGECEMALTGGVNLLLSPMPFLLFSKAGVLSPDGVCRVFDERAAGMVPGEGVVLYLLKRLEDAQRDGDRVLAVIKASAMNNDGQSLSLMAPALSRSLLS